MPQQQDLENTVTVNSRVFEDNFNVLSQIIGNNINYTEEHFASSETDNSLSTSNSERVDRQPLTQSFKYCILVIFSFIFLIYGCQGSLLGPALPDLTKLLNTTSESISVALSLKSLIFSVSTILVSFSFKIFGNRQLQYGIAVCVLAIINGLTPHMTSIKQYLFAISIAGFSSAFVDSVTNLVVLELFSLNSKVYMQMAHGAFTIGTIFGPLLVGPFLSQTPDNSTIPSTTTTTTTTTTTLKPTTLPDHNETTTVHSLITSINNTINDKIESEPLTSLEYEGGEFESRIYIPYSIVSTLLLIAAIAMITLQILHPYVPEKRKLFAKQKSKKIFEPLEDQTQDSQASTSPPETSANLSSSTSSNRKLKKETVCQQINLPRSYYLTFLGLTGLLLSTYTCIDGLTGLFMPSFLSKGELKFHADEAAFMSSLINMSMAVGRVLTIIFALKITCKILLFFNLSMILLGYITLTYFAIHSKFIAWFTMIMIGFGQSSTYPLVLSYIENRIVITNTVQLYLLFASTILLIFMPIIVGHFIDTAPIMFNYFNLSLAVLALSLMLAIHFTDMWKRKLIKQIEDDRQNLVIEDD